MKQSDDAIIKRFSYAEHEQTVQFYSSLYSLRTLFVFQQYLAHAEVTPFAKCQISTNFPVSYKNVQET